MCIFKTVKEAKMLERMLRGIGGFLVLLGLGLAYFYSSKWLILTGVVGFNLFQSGFTNWCPMMSILRALGIDKKEVKNEK
jgi:hypothetical protein